MMLKAIDERKLSRLDRHLGTYVCPDLLRKNEVQVSEKSSTDPSRERATTMSSGAKKEQGMQAPSR